MNRREQTVADFADLLGVHKSSASRLAATLVRRGFLRQNPRTRRFRLGPEVARLGLLAVGGQDLIALAREPMDRLAAQTRETVNLAVLEGLDVVNIAQSDGPHLVGVGNWIGLRTAAHCTSNGKALLAFLDVPLPAGPYAAKTERTIIRRSVLRQHLEEVRKVGWATNIGELEDGLNSVGVPVFDSAGRCVAALTVAGPAYRMPPERLPSLAEMARQTAAEITTALEGTVARSRTTSPGAA
jgi:DNA-binding IclR family transcriptional regulator